MTLRNKRELDNTREKLRLLEQQFEAVQTDSGEDGELLEAEMLSLKRLINQLKEEIARFEARQPAR